MAKMVEAVYEKGVFRPLEVVQCAEGQRVQVYLPAVPGELTAEQREDLLRETRKVFGELTDQEWEEIAKTWKRG
jgi:predicted DNA-binding antitoxin AbrB/MazE fold protein